MRPEVERHQAAVDDERAVAEPGPQHVRRLRSRVARPVRAHRQDGVAHGLCDADVRPPTGVNRSLGWLATPMIPPRPLPITWGIAMKMREHSENSASAPQTKPRANELAMPRLIARHPTNLGASSAAPPRRTGAMGDQRTCDPHR